MANCSSNEGYKSLLGFRHPGKRTHSALMLAYHDDLQRVRALVSTRHENDAVDRLEAALQANVQPDRHIIDEVTKIIRKAQRVDRYGH